jgi:DegV family protein with EDD domain
MQDKFKRKTPKGDSVVKVVVDSTADLPEKLVQEYDITVVPLSVQFGSQSYRDGIDISKDAFYERLVQPGQVMPTTSQPSLGDFEEVYRRLTADGSTVLSLHLHQRFSGTVRAAQQAAQLVGEDKVQVIDSGQIAMGLGFIAIEAVKALREGKSIDQIRELVRSLSDRTYLYVGLDTLQYLQQGGRIGRTRAFLGSLLSVKPIIFVRDGEPQPLEQVRTTKRIIPRLVELAVAEGPVDHLAVLYTSDRSQAQQLADRLVEAGLITADKLVIAQKGGVIGTHIGPGGIAVNGIRRA